MGTKYSSITVSGYNATPPPDNGATTANNIVSWGGADGVKTNLGDPLNVFAGAVNTALVAALDFGTRAAAGNETCTTADHMKSIECPVAMTGTLMTASTAGAGFIVGYKNTGAGSVTINLQTGTDTLNGTAAGSVQIANADGIVWFQVNAAANGYNSSVVGSQIAFTVTLPAQSGNSGKFITTNGSVARWDYVPVPINLQLFGAL